MDSSSALPQFKNYAFISYSRKDEREANWLHKALEGFLIPTGLPPLPDGAKAPKHVRPLFRDKTDLEVQPRSFVEQIERELGASRFLIVVCSPNAARSRPSGQHYVDWEIRQFIQAHGADYAQAHILPVILAGDPGCGDPERECLPPALLELGPAFQEHNFPLLKDLPEDRRGQAEAREQCVISCVAFLLGVARATIHDRHLRAQRERMRNYLALAAGVALALAGLTGWAVVERSRAETERGHAESAKNDALVARDLAKSKQAEAEAEKKRADEQAQVAIQQRDRANAARVQAEALVDSLTFQLRDRLNAAGNLAALQEMNEAVDRYHQSRDAAEQGKFDERTTDEMRRRAASLVNQVDAFLALGETDKAFEGVAEGLKQMWMLIVNDPEEMPNHGLDFVSTVGRLGGIMEDYGRPDLAERVYRSGTEFCAKLLEGFPDAAPQLQSGVFFANLNMGRFQMNRGSREESERYLRLALGIADKALGSAPEDSKWQDSRVTVLSDLGQLSLNHGDLPQARSLLNEALDVQQKLVSQVPDDVSLRFNLRCCLAKLGNCAQVAGEWDQAVHFYEEDVKILKGLVAVAPENLGWREALADSLKNMGFSFASWEKYPDAISAYTQAVPLFEPLLGKAAPSHHIDASLGEVYSNLGWLLWQVDKPSDAIGWHEKADRIVAGMPEANDDSGKKRLRVNVARGLALVCISLQRLDESMVYQKRLLSLARAAGDPGLVEDLFRHTELAVEMKQFDEAVSAYKELRGRSDAVPADLSRDEQLRRRLQLAWCGLLAGSFPAALDDAQAAVALLEEDGPSPSRMNYAHALLFAGRYAEAEAIYRKHLGQAFADGRKWNDELRNDIAALRAAGRDHPDLKKVEALLESAGAGPAASKPDGAASPR